MARQAARDVSVGIVVALALVVLAVGVMAVGESSQLFAPKAYYGVLFPHTDGLKVGSPVAMAGVEIGAVTAIRLPTEPEAKGIEVVLGIARDYAPRIRENSEAALRYLQILSGEKYVVISPGDPSLPELPEGATIRSADQPEFFEQGADIAENLNEITLALREILAPLQRGEGLLGEMIHNPEFGKPTAEALNRVLDDLSAVTAELRQGRGVVGRLLHDEAFGGTLDRFAQTVDRLAELTAELAQRPGALGALLEEEGPAEQAIQDLRASAASLRRLTERLDSQDSFFGRLLHDSEYSAALAEDLQATLRNLREITDKVNRGEGTLGALVGERVLYDAIEDVVAGVQDSKFARWLLRHYQKKGIKAREREERHRTAPSD